MERMAGGGKDDYFRSPARRGELLLHRGDLGGRDALVLAAIEPEHGYFELADEVGRVGRSKRVRLEGERSVPGDRRLEVRIMRGVEPGLSAAPAEADHG